MYAVILIALVPTTLIVSNFLPSGLDLWLGFVTWRAISKVPNVFTGSLSIAGMPLFQTSDYWWNWNKVRCKFGLWVPTSATCTCGTLPESYPAARVVSVQDNPEWRRPRWCPYNSWLGQVYWSLTGLGMWREDACRVPWGDHQVWRQWASEVTWCVCSPSVSRTNSSRLLRPCQKYLLYYIFPPSP